MTQKQFRKLLILAVVYLFLTLLTYVTPADSDMKTQEVLPAATTTIYRVTSVVDGDTIKVEMGETTETIRLLAIDTPETKDPRKEVQCFGIEAANKMEELVLNQNVRLEKDTQQGDRDSFGRLLRYVYLENNTFVNAEMVKHGYAFAYTQKPSDKAEEFVAYENEARTNRTGLWGSCQY